MHTTTYIQRRRKKIATVFATLTVGAVMMNAAARANNDKTLDANVMAALSQCKEISASCAATTKEAKGVLVFPNVVKADLIVGGAGGKGALVENGKITGYYNIGAVTAGLQAGVESASQVYVFRNAASLAQLKAGSDWKASASAGATLVDADANTSANTANVPVYIFDAKGLHAGVSVEAFNIWKDGVKRPVRDVSK